MTTLPYPPPWQDMTTLCAHICVSPNTVENWVAQGILPPPVKRGGKLMWQWAEVHDWLKNGRAGGLDAQAQAIRDGTRRAAESLKSN